MYEIDIKNVKKGRRYHYAFLIIGICAFSLLLFMSVSNIMKWQKLDSYVLSSSVSVDKEKDDKFHKYTAIYHYEVDGVDYSCKASSKSSNVPSRTNKNVYYDSSNPQICMIKKSIFSNCIMLIYWLIPGLFILSSISSIREINLHIKKIKELNKYGKLVKNLPYRLEKTGMSSNNIPIQRIVIDYILPNGETITLYGDARHDNKLCDDDGKVDLLIDENNLDNYYIDFEINRLSGNLPEDYYSQKLDNTKN